MRIFAVLLAGALAVSCGGSKDQPTAPSESSPSPQSWVLAGQVTDSVTGQPVPGAAVTIHGRAPITTGADGRWRYEGTGSADTRLSATILATGYVPRETFVMWRPEGRQDIALELIPERAPFAMSFYRHLVRNGLEEPGSLEPVRRWTTNPNFYIHTYNPKTGRALEAAELAVLVNTLRETVPQLTGGTLGAGQIETGDTPREARLGYINIKLVYEPSEDFCGRAYVGANPGQIDLNYDACSDVCRGVNVKIPPTAIAHELGHALGFWHVDKGLMNAYLSADCLNVQFSETERTHARLAYRRPNGNTDPDRDPPSFSSSTTANAPRITCAMSPRR